MIPETVVVKQPPANALDPERWWEIFLRIAPRSLAPTANKLRGRAPSGRSGKLGRGFDVRAKRIAQGFIRGVQAEIGARVPYGHLVAHGHKIIARGPTRKGRIISRTQRAAARRALSDRRAAGAIGVVPGHPFEDEVVREDRPQIVALIEKLGQHEVERAV